jgi:hypothetical protein
MNMKYTFFLLLICIGLFSSRLSAEPAQETPKTKLERFQAKTGSVIIRGFSKVGSLEGNLDTSILVDALEFTDASTGSKEYGITIDSIKIGPYSKGTSYIDLDEIESLIKGISYISKVDKSATQLSEFQADYQTKGDLRVSTFSRDNGEIAFALSSGGNTSYFNISDTSKIVSLLQDSLSILNKAQGKNTAEQSAAANP